MLWSLFKRGQPNPPTSSHSLSAELRAVEHRYHQDPDQWFAALADIYRRTGALDTAVEIARRGLKLRPEYISGHLILVRALRELGDSVGAFRHFGKALAIDPQNIIALHALVELEIQAGNSAEALKWTRVLLAVDPMNDLARRTVEQLDSVG